MKDLFDTLTAAAAHDPTTMFDTLANSLRERGRWHALFDLRVLQARVELGLPVADQLSSVAADVRDAFDDRSLAACREVGWPLLEEGSVAAGWMYLRAAAEPDAVGRKLRELAARPATDEDVAAERRQEIVHVALWEGVDPALGIELVLEGQGTCNAISAYEQAVARLPAVRQEAAAALLVDHLFRETSANLAADLERRGVSPPASRPGSLAALLAAAGGLTADPSVHVDVSHLQSVLRIARVATSRDVIEKAWELALYACRLPADAAYPGEPPFENVGEASRLFFGAQLGHDVEAAVRFFSAAAATARIEQAGALPAEILALLLWRLRRPAEALHALLERPAGDGMPSSVQAGGMLPSLLELAQAGHALDVLRAACRDRGDEVTFVATFMP